MIYIQYRAYSSNKIMEKQNGSIRLIKHKHYVHLAVFEYYWNYNCIHKGKYKKANFHFTPIKFRHLFYISMYCIFHIFQLLTIIITHYHYYNLNWQWLRLSALFRLCVTGHCLFIAYRKQLTTTNTTKIEIVYHFVLFSFGFNCTSNSPESPLATFAATGAS